MQIRKRKTLENVILDLSGELDFSNVDELKNQVLAEQDGGKITINMAAVDFIDSSGVGILLHLARELSEQNRVFEVINIPESIRESMALIGFFQVIEAIQVNGS
ncbi:MAG: Anti-sigma F factor antagonist [Pelotomaculum sp. PtaB.Bin013]|uniref:Anti-sigma factor antagonist n=1 Tax=Pelotomaculum isophthalicicum JI TaxID=947010 RepID=A0A9X4JU55_9FIRM|nr:STAS domain-containing protein [Pelotomaculum isophthalicicum]MDF9408500.1 STAS domain-containing protein [Pelotomaculum isophthalicicum JI]OPX89620.1 MAG: Anti-sigma F factor antagonist [Pelotomaculum sp. PtaB.Bin013]